MTKQNNKFKMTGITQKIGVHLSKCVAVRKEENYGK